MKSVQTLTAVLVAAALGGCVAVPYHGGGHASGYHGGGHSRVVDSRDCWREPVGSRSYTPEITGAIVGGAIGNRFGSGSGRDIATVAGAALGGSLGHDYKNRYHGQNYRVVCR